MDGPVAHLSLRRLAMHYDKQSPKTDDFRVERGDGTLTLVFTPDGRSYTFQVNGDDVSEPTVSPPQAASTDYADDEVRKTATELARLALKGSP
jgi:hypothetical protein